MAGIPHIPGLTRPQSLSPYQGSTLFSMRNQVVSKPFAQILRYRLMSSWFAIDLSIYTALRNKTTIVQMWSVLICPRGFACLSMKLFSFFFFFLSNSVSKIYNPCLLFVIIMCLVQQFYRNVTILWIFFSLGGRGGGIVTVLFISLKELHINVLEI